MFCKRSDYETRRNFGLWNCSVLFCGTEANVDLLFSLVLQWQTHVIIYLMNDRAFADSSMEIVPYKHRQHFFSASVFLSWHLKARQHREFIFEWIFLFRLGIQESSPNKNIFAAPKNIYFQAATYSFLWCWLSFWRSKESWQAQTTKIEFKEAGTERVQSVKCLPHKYWGLSSIPSTHRGNTRHSGSAAIPGKAETGGP